MGGVGIWWESSSYLSAGWGAQIRGLTSSEAKANKQMGLAVMLNEKNGKPILTTFAGQSVNENDILVKHPWSGDVNLDGVANAADYFLGDGGFINQAGALAAEEAPVQAEEVLVVKAPVVAKVSRLPRHRSSCSRSCR